MSRCEQELCPNWAGDGGCPCKTLGIEPQRPVCPECTAGKHAGCSHLGGVDEYDDIVDCACGCEPSRTCPQCADVVPPGFTLDDHFNCNWPEDA